MEKTRVQHKLCKSNLRYWNQWERGEGGATKVQEVATSRRQDHVRRSRRSGYLCTHRSADPVREVLCQECSRRTVLRPVYGCELHGECVRQPYKLANGEKPVRDCKGCRDRVEPGPS